MSRPSPFASSSRFSLEDWDTLSPLSNSESLSISRIQQRADERPLPSRLAILNPGGSRPSTPAAAGGSGRKASVVNLSASPGISSPARPASAVGRHPLHTNTRVTSQALGAGGGVQEQWPLSPILTPHQFHEHHSLILTQLELSQEAHYHHHLESLAQWIAVCEDVLDLLEQGTAFVRECEANEGLVEENERGLEGVRGGLVEEQKSLLHLSSSLTTLLSQFSTLESATRMLNLPGEELVLNEGFLDMLDKVEASLRFLERNPDFKDAPVYTIRFQQCLTRSMTLIKMYFVSTVKSLMVEVSDKMGGKELSPPVLHTLLYTKFSTVLSPTPSSSVPTTTTTTASPPRPSLRTLILELESRKTTYGSLLEECYAVWFACRAQLVGGELRREVGRMHLGALPSGGGSGGGGGGTGGGGGGGGGGEGDLVRLARAGCNHLRSVCLAEWELFAQCFGTGEVEVYKFLETLCDHLYDSLRPRILHESKLEVLCELCTVLTAMMALDSAGGLADDSDTDSRDDDNDDEEGYSDDDGDRYRVGGRGKRLTLPPFRFSTLLETVLQDAQTRLVFRSQAVIEAEVDRFVPSKADLDYPGILVREGGGAGRGVGIEWDDDADDGDAETGKGFRVPRESEMRDWYPTLRKTVWVLSKLDSYVNNTIFEDFASEAISLCRRSLSSASLLVGAKEGNSKIDGQLFLVRHLLVLKEMVRSVDLERVERAADFSSVTDALFNLLKNTSVIFNPNALFELASKGIPSFAETMTDAKLDLDATLKATCEAFITDTSLSIALPLRTFLDRCTAFLSSPSGKDLPGQTWATADEVLKLHTTFTGEVEDKVRETRDKLECYLGKEGTVGVLLPPLLDEIVDTYSTFYNLTRSEYGFDTSSSLLAPAVVKERLEAAAKGGAKIEPAHAQIP
ncbi:Sec34-domain-containing protein [Meredithblackwellia eburnea MCA 4105]